MSLAREVRLSGPRHVSTGQTLTLEKVNGKNFN
jgi:hypothetical protein